MQAIEFEADIKEGVVKLPPEYQHLKNTHARIVVLFDATDAQNGANYLTTGKVIDFSNVELPSMAATDGVDFQRKLRDDW